MLSKGVGEKTNDRKASGKEATGGGAGRRGGDEREEEGRERTQSVGKHIIMKPDHL